MCDTLMLALWLWAIIFWVEGLDPPKPRYLAISALLITLCALTKYFGIALIPLLAGYSFSAAPSRRLGLVLPAAHRSSDRIPTLDQGGLWPAHDFGSSSYVYGRSASERGSALTKALVDLSFVGGDAASVDVAPILWPRKKVLAVCLASGIAGFLIGSGRISLGEMLWPFDFYEHWLLVGVQLTLFIAAGFSVLALAVADAWKQKDAGSLLLMLWVAGTFTFTGFLNWAINARSVLP